MSATHIQPKRIKCDNDVDVDQTYQCSCHAEARPWRQPSLARRRLLSLEALLSVAWVNKKVRLLSYRTMGRRYKLKIGVGVGKMEMQYWLIGEAQSNAREGGACLLYVGNGVSRGSQQRPRLKVPKARVIFLQASLS